MIRMVVRRGGARSDTLRNLNLSRLVVFYVERLLIGALRQNKPYLKELSYF
jgi:hypothetical protein